MTDASRRSTTNWQSGLPARLGAATVVGAVTGGAMLLAGYLIPVSPITVDCHPAGGIGCAIFASITGMLLGALRWLAVVVATAVGVGVALNGLSVRFVGVRLGITAPLAWPGMLWAVAVLLRPAGTTVHLSGAAVVGYAALAFVLTATLTAPQVRLAARLVVTGLLALAVMVILVLH